jgi:PBP1b-binding outer membrane lipoprotein LpoB
MKKILFIVLLLSILLSGCTKKKALTWNDVFKKTQELEKTRAETMKVIGAKE